MSMNLNKRLTVEMAKPVLECGYAITGHDTSIDETVILLFDDGEFNKGLNYRVLTYATDTGYVNIEEAVKHFNEMVAEV